MQKIKFQIVIILIIVISVIIICFLTNDNAYKPKYNLQNNPVYVENVNYIYSKPYLYKGEFVDITGQIFYEPQRNRDYTAFQMYVDPQNKEKAVVIYYDGPEELNAGECVNLTGYIYKTVKGRNVYGGTVYFPGIKATKLENKSCIEVLSPTTKELVFTDKKITYDNYSIAINKIQFSSLETRIYLTVNNNGNYDFNLWYGGVMIVQNNQQYEQIWNENIDYPTLNYQIKPGVEDKGIIVFPKLSYDSFNIFISANHSNSENIYNYDFTIEVSD